MSAYTRRGMFTKKKKMAKDQPGKLYEVDVI